MKLRGAVDNQRFFHQNWAQQTNPPPEELLVAQAESQLPGDDPMTWMASAEVRYLYDGFRVIQERDSNNIPTVSYTRGRDLSGSLQGAGGIGGLLARSHIYGSYSGNWSGHNYYHADANGNISKMVSPGHVVAASYRYDPFGNLVSKSGPLADANVYRFSSKEIHLNSGLYYFGYRFYSPNLQRWINRDPIGERGGINLYNYVGSDPLSRIDPLGLWWWDGDYIEWGVGGLLGLKGSPGTAGEACSGFAEGWSKGGQGVINDFTGGLFDSQYGLFYDSFDKLDKEAFGSGIKCDSAFKFGSNAGRVAEGALLAAGAVWGLNAAGLPTMDVAVGSGSPFHVAYGSGGTWVHASSIGGRGLGSLLVTEKGAETYVAFYSWFQVTGIPILSPTTALATGGTAATCVGAACTGFVRGWLPFLPW